MSIRPRSHGQVVLASEAQRFLVVGLEEEAGVVDLEHVDLGEVVLQRRGLGDRVQPVERMG